MAIPFKVDLQLNAEPARAKGAGVQITGDLPADFKIAVAVRQNL
jgi:hypothetical protein